ncbi:MULTISPECIES: hypothetical protein [Azospirillum]|nr:MULTISPECIES: hypothetical protein [Azospirillum]MDW7555552.1 hypothetical protein [Azospirillum brasilense]MDW7595479.1 hypothetical protein [Azospirillum brasilense]MDW7630484.1 hypothetical protein [Azospirillum brasilense]MDX5954320.1 hypothetical protein [Azospirillum brasilense]TVZ61664.1 hypothetical protein OH82_02068 [Azospirillum brasilense]
MTRRTEPPPQPPSLSQPITHERPAPGFTVLPLDDRRCPRREVAVLCETDSGHRWDGA